MRRASFLTMSALLALSGVSRGQDELYKPEVASASPEAAQAAKSIRLPAGFKLELFAAEPLLANPVAFWVDERGKFYVAETFRLHAGVTDNRSHMNWLDADMACRTVNDRVEMYKKYLGKDGFAAYNVEHERVRLIEDRDGDGKADHSTVFADGFKEAADGIGAGVLARKGDVYFTCIPSLWKLTDTNGDGKADKREALSTGYGVHVAFLGHDLHGLKMGPDGRLYFSIGDRGLDVMTKEGKHLSAPDCGSVLRCDPDGANLEIYATGLRNPQELAFDNFGNLFTCDNNSDGGDKARWVHVVEGSDSGWRMGYQYLDFPTGRGPWNAEKLWHPRWDGQAAYLLPPITNIADGPSGLVHDPGTGLPAKYRDHFFLADFRGGAGNSGIRSFANKPKGASFELVDSQEFTWSVLATDVDFGPDGSMYITDWVNGWNKTGKGRIWKLTPEETDDRSAEVKKLLAEGMNGRPVEELAKLLGHADQRVRLEAQYELAERATKKDPAGHRSDLAALSALMNCAMEKDHSILVKVHAIWGMSQERNIPDGMTSFHAVRFLGLLGSEGEDAEVRAQAAKALAEFRPLKGESLYPESGNQILLRGLSDPSPRVRFYTAMALGKHGKADAVAPLFKMLAENNDADAYLRHAAVMGLAGIGDVAALVKASTDASPAVRLGALLALRRLGSPEAAKFLVDSEPRIATEAALAIYESPINDALPALSALAGKKGMTEAMARRAINAANRTGRGEDASNLATVATDKEAKKNVRVESLSILAAWANPPGRDRINGLWRPIDARPSKVAADALRPAVKGLIADSPDEVRREAIKAVVGLDIREAGPDLLALIVESKGSPAARVEAIAALEKLEAPSLAEAVESAVTSKDSPVRSEGLRVLAKLSPERAIPALAKVIEGGSTREKQKAIDVLGSSDRPEADAILAKVLDAQVSKPNLAIELELLDAAGKRKSSEVREKLDRFERDKPKGSPASDYRAMLEGGDVERGKKIYKDSAAVYCVRCHKVKGEGGEVGPELTGIGTRHPRTYLLESIVAPNLAIAQGFETVIVEKNDGTTVVGVLKSEDAKTVKLMTAEAKLVEVVKSDIEERKRGASAMPEDLVKKLSKAELRDVVEFLSSLK